MDVKRCKTLNGFVITRKEPDPGSEVDLDVKRGEIDSWLIELPLPLIYDILLRLHAETISSCRCVCKTFYAVLTDPQFAQDHLAKAPNFEEGLVIEKEDDTRDILSIYSHKSVLKKTEGDHATLSVKTIAPLVFVSASLVGSCNGLLCIRNSDDLRNQHYYVCNPILGEILALPYHHQATYLNHCAFGFCPKTMQYKVIRFFSSSLCKIHTLGTDCWREISDIPNAYNGRSFGQSFRGFLHWIVTNFTISKLICSFNLEKEQASFLHAPVHIDPETLDKLVHFQTGTLDGLFCLSYSQRLVLDVCVMKNYGVNESWSKAFSFNLSGPINKLFRGYTLVWCYIVNGNFFFKDQQSVVGYNLQTGTITKLPASDILLPQIMPFRPSFISLKDVANAPEVNVKVVQREMGQHLV